VPSESDPPAPPTGDPAGLDPADLATTLRVLAELDTLDDDHPHFVAVRQATAKMFRAVKQARKLEARERDAAADRAVVAATATGAPDRLDEHRSGDRRHPAQGAPLLHLQAAVHGG
jgi:hypothetical protein